MPTHVADRKLDFVNWATVGADALQRNRSWGGKKSSNDLSGILNGERGGYGLAKETPRSVSVLGVQKP